MARRNVPYIPANHNLPGPVVAPAAVPTTPVAPKPIAEMSVAEMEAELALLKARQAAAVVAPPVAPMSAAEAELAALRAENARLQQQLAEKPAKPARQPGIPSVSPKAAVSFDSLGYGGNPLGTYWVHWMEFFTMLGIDTATSTNPTVRYMADVVSKMPVVVANYQGFLARKAEAAAKRGK